MRIRPLMLGGEQMKEIAACVAYAKAHPYKTADLFRLMDPTKWREVPANNPAFVVNIPVGYRAVFTYDQQQLGWMRHISVSVPEPGMCPNLQAFVFIAREFGFTGSLQDWHLETEDIYERAPEPQKKIGTAPHAMQLLKPEEIAELTL